MDHTFLITSQLHGTVKLFLDLRESRLWIGGGAVGDVGLTNILNDTVQIIMDRVAKKVTFLYLSQLQRADIKVICKFYDLLKSDEQKNFLVFYKERKMIIRTAFARYLEAHPDLRRRC